MKPLSRRGFLKVAGLSAASLAAAAQKGAIPFLAGNFWAGELLPGNGLATTCSACPAGCGLIASGTSAGNQLLEANPYHPHNLGSLCERGYAASRRPVQDQRWQGPMCQAERFSGGNCPVDWSTAAHVVADVFQRYHPQEIGFLLGLFPDHLHDLVRVLSKKLGGASVLRLRPPGAYDGRVTLMDAAQMMFGVSQAPYFDVTNAELVYTFGATYEEGWLAPLLFRSVHAEVADVRLVHLGSNAPPDSIPVDNFIQIRPGSERWLVQALGWIVSKHTGRELGIFSQELPGVSARACGISVDQIEELALRFAQPGCRLAVPGSLALGQKDGLALARAILALNLLVSEQDAPCGISFLPALVNPPMNVNRPSTFAEISSLVERIHSGQIKALFVHGCDPLADLPDSLEVDKALARLELMVSFSGTKDATSKSADYVFPDRLPLEAWGYQKVAAGIDRLVFSAVQPVLPPSSNTCPTVDLLLEAARIAGVQTSGTLDYTDEIDYLKSTLYGLNDLGGQFQSADKEGFWSQWLAHGGWWQAAPVLLPAVVLSGSTNHAVLDSCCELAADEFFLQPFHLDGAGEEVWVEMHPQSAQELGLHSGETIHVSSITSILQVVLKHNSALPLKVLALPISSAALSLLDGGQNASGDLAWSAARARVMPIG